MIYDPCLKKLPSNPACYTRCQRVLYVTSLAMGYNNDIMTKSPLVDLKYAIILK